MKIAIAYDVETTNLPLWNQPSSHPDQPYVTQLAAELFDEETGTTLAGMDVIIKPEGWVIPQELQELTGITMELANRVGVPMLDAMHVFMELWQNADMRIAHNEAFDARLMRIEIMRHGFYSRQVVDDAGLTFADHWKASPAYCTCSNSTSIVNLPPTEKMRRAGRNTPKQPKLGEAYLHFTGQPLEGAHNARVDIMACKEIYFALKRHHAQAAAA